MATSKYKDYFNQMFDQNREQFTQFMLVCQDYMQDKAAHSDEFNRLGKPVKAIMTEWETKLCGRMERGKNSVYSANVAEKFWDEVRKYFPCIDEVGVKVTKLR
jgi:hypothetical protein